MPALPDHTRIYVSTMGKAVRVTAIFANDNAANAHLALNPDEGVISEIGDVIFIANVNDLGVDLPHVPSAR
ncbi:hypothetical protein [Hyphomicrobium sp. DY-1]|uniref:hypothetical protein n=1 Tax=Hyphomicrobium sp. DY-1 TaxID=3075650 RepID=UPI0039C3C7C4